VKPPPPPALMALQYALATVTWSKRDFETFIRAAVPAPDVLDNLNWHNTKKNTAGELISGLASQQERYGALLHTLMAHVASMEDFSHLDRSDHTGGLARDARKAVEALKKWLPQSDAVRPRLLGDNEYEVVLKTLRDSSMALERNPQSFRDADEETIRDHLIVPLNGLFHGQATAETFNGNGKTDILLRSEGKNVFIAECKFWNGPAAFDEAVDQLFNYLTWRDCKCAILVFNRNRDSTAVERKMHEGVCQRAEYRRTICFESRNRGQYILAKSSDPEQEITLTTLLFDVPTS
jgi:hypothetical protein